jgi:hypothetical protein
MIDFFLFGVLVSEIDFFIHLHGMVNGVEKIHEFSLRGVNNPKP